MVTRIFTWRKIARLRAHGQIRIVSAGKVSEPLSGLPKNLYIKGQGGVLDVVLHPNYSSNNWVYVSYVIGTDDKNALQVMRAKLSGNKLTQQQTIFTVSPFKDTPFILLDV